MAWRQAEGYAWCEELTAAEWAWQFLRRNPEYQRDYAWFISVWQELEALYGAPPHRDFVRWRLDPRAWRSEAELTQCSSEGCAAEDDKVLIECWFGAKWGLRKFPIAPDVVRPEPGMVLDWREQPLVIPVLDGESLDHLQRNHGKIGLGFDLSLPLDAQLANAKRVMLGERRVLEKAGILPARTLAMGRRVWVGWLRLLDGLAAGASLAEVAAELDLANPDEALIEAQAMASAGYRRILLLEH